MNCYDNLKNKNCCNNKTLSCCQQGPRGLQGKTGAIGPTGATGPIGISETIKVRNTITREAGTSAQVVDFTGSPNHTLDFFIPKGDKGDIGPVGPQGRQGDIGISERIFIRETKTGDSGTLANVEDDFSMNIHNLTFTIPKGTDAPISELSIAQLFKTTTQTFTGIGQSVEFSINQNFRNSLTTQRTIQVLKSGTYRIEYGFNFSSLTNIKLTLFIDDLDMKNSTLLFNQDIMSNNGVLLMVLDENNELSIRVQEITGDAVLEEGILNGYLIVSPVG